MSHQAQYSQAILDSIALKLSLTPAERVLPVFDPFAGLGTRLGRVCDDLDIPFSGIDLEDWPGRDHRVWQANAVDLESYPTERCLIITSPTYANGMNDHFVPRDGSKRYTYRIALGHELHIDNSGRYGLRAGKKSLDIYWAINRCAVACWAERGFPTLVNVKDFPFTAKGEVQVYPLVKEWVGLLQEFGYRITHQVSISTPGNRNGSNKESAVNHEVILAAEV